MKYFYLILLFSLFCSGCDIPGKILIENYTGRNAIYRCDFLNETNGLIDINMELWGAPPHNKANIYMGFGYIWTDENINEYAGEINRLEIISSKDSLILSDQNEISNFFRINRQSKRVIKIKFE